MQSPMRGTSVVPGVFVRRTMHLTRGGIAMATIRTIEIPVLVTLSPEILQRACGGDGINWRKVGEYAAPVLMANPITAPVGAQLMNKPAAAQGAIWGAGGAIAGASGGLPGAALGAAGGGLAGYYGSLVGRDYPVK
ncbi:MAG: hypothetical protein ABI867_26350 [Kofleriaceae bacterium]